MVDVDLALIDAFRPPHAFLEKLKELKIRTIEITPLDVGWIVNCLAVRPGRVIIPEGASERTLDELGEYGVKTTTVPDDKMQLNGGGMVAKLEAPTREGKLGVCP